MSLLDSSGCRVLLSLSLDADNPDVYTAAGKIYSGKLNLFLPDMPKENKAKIRHCSGVCR